MLGDKTARHDYATACSTIASERWIWLVM
jgi:hypothetical protein